MRSVSTAAALLLASSSAFAQAPGGQAKSETIGVASVETRGAARADDGAELGDALAAALVADGRLRVVERQHLAKVMKEQALAQSGVMSDEVQIELAKLVGARYIAVGTVAGGRSWSVGVRVMDTNAGTIVFAENQKIGNADQIEGGAKALARKIGDKIAGGQPVAGGGRQDAVGDFDPSQVKDGAKALVRSLAMRFPKIEGKVVEPIPDGTSRCFFPSPAKPFAGQRFEVVGQNEVTGQLVRKGFFLVTNVGDGGHACSGRFKRDGSQAVVQNDTLKPLPFRFQLDNLEAGQGADASLATLLSEEIRNGVKALPQFSGGENDAQLTALGRVAGPRSRRTVSLQVVDKSGNVVSQLEVPGSY